MPLDQKALRILLDTYWSASRWKSAPSTDPGDFGYARQAGYMFDPIELTHDQLVEGLLSVRRRISLNEAADAFVASLSTRRLDLRSALGSFAFATHFPQHQLAEQTSTRVPSGRLHCRICGVYGSSGPKREDLNVLNFERYKWGGVRHLDPLYASFDLIQFETMDRPSPTPEDYSVLTKIIEVAQTLSPKARANDLEKSLSKSVHSNASERRVLIQILAYCGILQPSGRAGFFQTFVSAKDQNSDQPPDHKNDWRYPAIWWRGADGVNREALIRCFPAVADMI
jgi:hypothetical protein